MSGKKEEESGRARTIDKEGQEHTDVERVTGIEVTDDRLSEDESSSAGFLSVVQVLDSVLHVDGAGYWMTVDGLGRDGRAAARRVARTPRESTWDEKWSRALRGV
jgi:hypothetical protein